MMGDGPRFYLRGFWLVLARLAGIGVLLLIVFVIASAILVSRIGLNEAMSALRNLLPG
jgi:hypothetical protein